MSFRGPHRRHRLQLQPQLRGDIRPGKIGLQSQSFETLIGHRHADPDQVGPDREYPVHDVRLRGGKNQHMPGLDGLRALAVVAVVWHHTHPGYASLPISHNGFLGVDVFFVLSGFLISTLLLSELGSTGSISLKNFYIRRSLRIFPLYYVVLALMLAYVLTPYGPTQRSVILHELPFHASYTSNWVHLESMLAITWSLSTEEQFYLAWPPLLVWLGVRSIWVLGAFLVVNQAVNFGFFHGTLAWIGMPYQDLPILQITFTPIVLGVLVAFGLRLAAFKRFLDRLPSWALLASCVLAVAVANIPGDIRGWPRLAFHLATALVIAQVVTRPACGVVRALEWRPMAYVGTVSYGVYLLHKLVLHAVHHGLEAVDVGAPEAVFAVCVLGTVGLATLSYWFFEAPILRLKARFH